MYIADTNTLRHYMRIARPSHWFKNVFILPGYFMAWFAGGIEGAPDFSVFAMGMVSACMITSANYVINELLDAEFDRHHPLKNNRPGALGLLNPTCVFAEYFSLAGGGLALGWIVGPNFMAVAALLLVAGLLYNVPPFRFKDVVFLDVVAESINNPLRLALGWFMTPVLGAPPLTALLAFWFGGAFLMAVKRYSEYCLINDPERAGNYRRSFKFYTKETLLLSSFFYANNAVAFLAAFLYTYGQGFFVFFPALSVMFCWYFMMGLRGEKVAQAPERMFRHKYFLLCVFGVSLVLLVCISFTTHKPGHMSHQHTVLTSKNSFVVTT